MALLLLVGAVAAVQADPIVLEGEDAISTNFAPEAVQLFGAGGNLVLQLNQASLLSDSPYYAEFAFLADEEGEYQLWYGGGVPGALDPFLPSYGSPFNLSLNDGEAQVVSGESVRAGPVYSTPYRWIHAGTVQVQAGQNRLRVTVDQRRRYDNRYFLYLDRFVLVPAGTEVPWLPPEEELVAPEAVEDLLILLREDPSSVDAYLRLAHLYTLLGDNINALRYLSRAQLLDSSNEAILQLVARNTVWRGDFDGGLAAYWALVSAAPQNIENFLEAGKIAAWSGFLAASEQYYLAGLGHHREDPRLQVNLAYTYLWWNREDRARELFSRAERTAATEEAVLAIGSEYRLNADPRREEELYRGARERFPGSRRIAVRLLDAVFAQGRVEDARELRSELERLNPEATAALAEVVQRYDLRDAVIAGYEEAVAEYPRDLSRRFELAQTWLWIGRRDEGMRVYRNFLAALTQAAVQEAWQNSEEDLWLGVQTGITRLLLRDLLQRISTTQATLSAALQQLQDLEGQEGADTAPTRQTVAVHAGALRGQIAAVRQALALQEDATGDGTAGDRASEIEEGLQERLEELAGIREQLRWSPPTEILTAEVAGADDLVGNQRLRLLLNNLLGQEQEQGPGVVALPSSDQENVQDILRRDLAVLLQVSIREAPAADAVQQWFILEDLVVQDQDQRGVGLLLFTELLREHLERLAQGEGASAPAAAAAAAAVDRQSAEALLAEALELIATLAVTIRELAALEELVVRSTRANTELALFYLQNRTAPERDRLSQLLIDLERIDEAVVQLELVQMVDPTNLPALYTLAQAYRRQGRWRQAQNLLQEIYLQDPTFRNTVVLHNDIARQYADQLTTGVRISTERQRVDTRTVLGYQWRINSRFSVVADLEMSTVRARVPAAYDDQLGDDGEQLQVGVVRRLAYQDYLLNAGVQLFFWQEQAMVEPFIGVRLLAHNLYYATLQEELITSVYDGADYFGSYWLEPEPGVRWSLSRGEVFTSGVWKFGAYTPVSDVPLNTARLERPAYRAHSVSGDLSWNLQNRTDPLWQRYSQRTGGSADVILRDGENEGIRYRLQQEFRMGLIRRSEPFTRLGITALAGFEDYAGDAAQWYFQPDTVFESGARLDWQLYRPLQEELVWGLAGTVYGGYYHAGIISGGGDPALRGALQVTAELTRRNVAFQLGLSASRVLSVPQFSDFPNDGGYYDLGVSMMMVARNFRLLAR